MRRLSDNLPYAPGLQDCEADLDTERREEPKMKKRFFKTKDEVEVTFETEGDEFEGVSLYSDHNAWEPIPMKRMRTGGWKVALRLPPDRDVQFRYLASGDRWMNDPSADSEWGNEYGTANSVVSTFRE
jgi:hypothetical protein